MPTREERVALWRAKLQAQRVAPAPKQGGPRTPTAKLTPFQRDLTARKVHKHPIHHLLKSGLHSKDSLASGLSRSVVVHVRDDTIARLFHERWLDTIVKDWTPSDELYQRCGYCGLLLRNWIVNAGEVLCHLCFRLTATVEELARISRSKRDFERYARRLKMTPRQLRSMSYIQIAEGTTEKRIRAYSRKAQLSWEESIMRSINHDVSDEE